MAKPTTQPTWATDGGSIIRSPNAGKKAMGFTAEERPPAEYLNWFFYWTAQWIDHLQYESKKLSISGAAFTPAAGTADVQHVQLGAMAKLTVAGAEAIVADVPLHVGDRITAVKFYVNEQGATPLTGYLQSMDAVTPYDVQSHGAGASPGTTAGATSFSIATGGLPLTLVEGRSYSLYATFANLNDEVFLVEIDYDRT